jgi:hypothetical protein
MFLFLVCGNQKVFEAHWYSWYYWQLKHNMEELDSGAKPALHLICPSDNVNKA